MKVLSVRVLAVCLVALMALVLSASVVQAASTSTLKGMVDYVYDEDYNQIGGTLTTGEGAVYNIVWNAKGREMVDDVYEEEAEVIGEVSAQNAYHVKYCSEQGKADEGSGQPRGEKKLDGVDIHGFKGVDLF